MDFESYKDVYSPQRLRTLFRGSDAWRDEITRPHNREFSHTPKEWVNVEAARRYVAKSIDPPLLDDCRTRVRAGRVLGSESSISPATSTDSVRR